jgi:glutamine amidotransferase
MQMMMSRSFEFGETTGLDMFHGDVQMLAANAARAIRLPHIGWTMLREPEPGRWRDSVLDNGHDRPPSFYFVHSFAVVPLRPSEVLATASNGAGDFIAAIQRDNICGTQFHPEKSGPAGLALLSKFLKLCET